MEDRTQIKFNNPDIDGTPQPQLITLEQETPIEGTGERDSGETFTYHKWLCTSLQYFMASDSLDGMLKLIPNKTGKPLKIEKVVNPKGGFPFFQINGMNKDAIVAGVNETNISTSIPVSETVTKPATTDSGLTLLEQKLDKIIAMLYDIQMAVKPKEELPF